MAEFKTFLKVGQMTPDISAVTPFTIEWIPDLLVGNKMLIQRVLNS